LQKTRIELEAALQEARMSEKRKDWALNERDQAIRERDSIRILCDELRRERDRALSEMARVLRNSDDIQRQLQQTFAELKGQIDQLDN
jgi:discs large protein 5